MAEKMAATRGDCSHSKKNTFFCIDFPVVMAYIAMAFMAMAYTVMAFTFMARWTCGERCSIEVRRVQRSHARFGYSAGLSSPTFLEHADGERRGSDRIGWWHRQGLG